MTDATQGQIVAKAEEATSPVVEHARSIVVGGPETLDLAGAALSDLKRAKAVVTNIFAEPKARTHAAHKSIVAAEKKVLAPLVEADGYLRAEVVRYQTEVERERQEAAATARKAAVEAAEAERARRFKEAAAEGDKETADMVEAAPTEAFIQPAIEEFVAETPTTEGVAVRYDWKAEVPDLGALVKAVAAGGVPLKFLIPDDKVLNAFAKTTGGQMSIPGVRFYQKPTTVVRGR